MYNYIKLLYNLPFALAGRAGIPLIHLLKYILENPDII